MNPVIVAPIWVGLAIIGAGAGCAALILGEQRAVCSELRSLTERVTALDQRVSGLDCRLARLEGAFSVAFARPHPPEIPPPKIPPPDPGRRA